MSENMRPVSAVEIAGTPMVAKWDYDRVAQQLAEAVDLLGEALDLAAEALDVPRGYAHHLSGLRHRLAALRGQPDG